MGVEATDATFGQFEREPEAVKAAAENMRLVQCGRTRYNKNTYFSCFIRKDERSWNFERFFPAATTRSCAWMPLRREIRALCDQGMRYGCASVCIPASYVKRAAEYVDGKIAICTVIGFPNGYDTTAAKCFMATDAVENGAEEVDMVINLGWVKDQKWDDLLAEIKAVKAACKGRLLKVIIECCFLTDEEKIKMCEIVSDSGADYIKTSTGFAQGGATVEDVKLFREHISPDMRIKAAGASVPLSRPRPCWMPAPTVLVPALWWPCTRKTAESI